MSSDLSVTMDDGVTTVVPGTSDTYTITVTNNGPDTLGSLTLTDAIPIALQNPVFGTPSQGSYDPISGIWSGLTLASGQSVSITLSGVINPSASGTISNTATVSPPSGVTDPNPANNSFTDTDTLTPQADLSITNTDGVVTVAPGGSTTYTIVVSNNGPSTAVAASVTDLFPSAITAASWTAVASPGSSVAATSGAGNINTTVTLLPGGSATYTAVGQISSSATGTISNTATVTPPPGLTDPNPANNSATDTDAIPITDLSVTVNDGVTSVVPGTINTYAITVTNKGPDTVSSLTLFDAIPAVLSNPIFSPPSQGSYDPVSGVWNGLSLASGQSVSITLSGAINPSATGTISNTVTVLPVGTDPNPGNNSFTDTDTLTPQADLSITNTDGVVTVAPGGSTTYTIVVSNNGPSTAVAAAVTDLFPSAITAASWTAVASPGSSVAATSGAGDINTTVTLLPGGSATYTAVGQISSSATGTISNTAIVTPPPGVTDPNPANNSATDADALTPQADLSVTKTVSDPTPNVGEHIIFTVTLSDSSPGPATGVQVTDLLPAGVSLLADTTSQGSYDSTSGLWTVGTVSPGVPQTLTVTGLVVSPSAQTNTATITHADQFDPTTADNTASVTETPQQADLSVAKTVSDATPNVGEQITFTVTLSDIGPDAATGVQVTDLLPTGVSFLAATPSEGTYNNATGLWTVGTVSPGVPQTLIMTGTVVSFSPQTNTATISHADQFDPITVDNSASVTETPQAPCYCAGTLIFTNRGEVPVETLAIGDKVMTADGVARLIRWIGRRSYSGRFARGNHVLPICIKAGALDENLPRRDLWISPNHAMFLHGVLIEAQDLVNGASIVQAASVERVDYFHIELDTHDVIVAEGASSESFVDDDSRGMFQNVHEFQALYPDERARPDPYCAPRVAFGAQVEAARQQIARRAGIPYRRPTAESRPCALVVDNQIPKSGHDAGANAILDHMRALQVAGFQVSFLALRHDGTNTHALSSLGVTPLSLPQNERVSEVMRAHAGRFDLVYLHRVESAMYCLKLARQYFDAQIVYSVADLHHVRLKTQGELDHDHASELMQQANFVALHELAAALSSDRVITHSQSEAKRLEELPSIAAEHKVRVVPWTVPIAAVRTPFADRSGIAFIGGFAHAPNVDAARWLVDEIMPLVWREAPDLPCLIAGSDMSEDLHRQLARPGVKLLGRVERLSEVFERARLTVAPLRFGAGLKDKVLRSMAAGLPCIGTSEAFNGMQGLPGAITSVCRRDTAPGLAAAVVSMHRDETANTRCSQAGLSYIGAFYNEARVDALIREVAQPALDRFRARVKSKTLACEVLQFAAGPSFAQANIAANARGRERRIVFT